MAHTQIRLVSMIEYNSDMPFIIAFYVRKCGDMNTCLYDFTTGISEELLASSCASPEEVQIPHALL